MEFLTHPVAAAVVMIGLLIFVHEAGHFLVGRFCGIGVEIFSVGFGPPIFEIKRGATSYRLSWIPLGGFVKFYGMMPQETVPDEIKGKEFRNASLGKRVATVSAGPLANLLLAVVAHTVLGMTGIPHPQAIIGEVQENSPAQQAGLQFNDKVVAINAQAINTWFEMRDIIARSAGKQLHLTIARDGQQLQFDLVPESADGENMHGEKVKIGRAGISRGAVPAIVAVTEKESWASRAGFETGSRILRVITPACERDVKYWAEFQACLLKAIQAKNAKLHFVIAKTHKDGTADQTTRHEIVASLPTVKDATIPARRILSDLGLADAQLVIGEWQGETASGLGKNDRVVAWDGTKVRDVYHLLELQSENHTETVQMEIQRGGATFNASVTLKAVERQLPSGKDVIYVLPVAYLGTAEEPELWIEKYDNVFLATAYGIRETASQTTFLAATLAKLFSGDVPLKALGGPMLIAKVAGDAAEAGWQVFVGTLALISVNLAVINLFPLPALDGGQLVVFGVEAIRRKRLSDVAVENFQKIGFAVILALVVLATYNDLSRFWSTMLRSVSGFFEG